MIEQNSEYFEEQGSKVDTESHRSKSHDLASFQRSYSKKSAPRVKASFFSFVKRSDQNIYKGQPRSQTPESFGRKDSSESGTILFTTQSNIERFLQSADTTAQIHLRELINQQSRTR